MFLGKSRNLKANRRSFLNLMTQIGPKGTHLESGGAGYLMEAEEL